MLRGRARIWVGGRALAATPSHTLLIDSGGEAND